MEYLVKKINRFKVKGLILELLSLIDDLDFGDISEVIGDYKVEIVRIDLGKKEE